MNTATALIDIPPNAAYSAAQPDGTWAYWMTGDADMPDAVMEPDKPVSTVTRRQMFTALHRVGLLAAIKSAVAMSTDVELQIAFAEAQDFQSDNPFIAAMATKMGKSDADVAAIFALAATI